MSPSWPAMRTPTTSSRNLSTSPNSKVSSRWPSTRAWSRQNKPGLPPIYNLVDQPIAANSDLYQAKPGTMSTTLIASPPAARSAFKPRRIESIDLLRGIVMIIMALDHARDYFNRDAYLYDPTDMTRTNDLLFFTRWITHFCAPIFMFLAGTAAFLYGLKKGTKAASFFLLTRGIWLIFIELTVVTIGWTFNVHLTFYILQVIW